MRSLAPFSLTGPLPTGRVAIEASAGTGKTFTLASLVLRCVAEAAVPVDQLLVVTFGRAAAAELRDRVRTRLTDAVAALRHPGSAPADDELLTLLAATDREHRLERLERAVGDVDTATITTIHSFAQQVLATLGSAAPGDLDATLVEDTRAVVTSVCTDLIAALATAGPGSAGPDSAGQLPAVADLSATVTTVLGNPGIRLVPDLDDDTATPGAILRRQLVDQAVAHVHRRRRLAGTVSFDDLLTQLLDALRASTATVAALRRRYRVALVDEFQDTDPVQWALFSTLFGEPGTGTTLVLVADPKQAIYGFRGADVHTYLRAASTPGTDRSSLGVNWRSDPALLDALGRLFDGATFGHPDITFVPVHAAPGNDGRRLRAASGAALPALSVRAAVGPDLERGKAGLVVTEKAERAVAADLAGHILDLLSHAQLPPRHDGSGARPLRPGDVAVLIGRHAEARTIQRALRDRGIPAVVARGENVLGSDAARHWRWLLGALARPADPTRARTATQSCFFGWSLADIATADDATLDAVQDDLARWADILATRGTVELCAHLWVESGVVTRVLATADGDRMVTDLGHIAALLHNAPAGRRPTPGSLLATLDHLRDQPDTGTDQDVTTQRVESEAEAVQIMTVHAAKGLEFPVVCVPTMWRGSLLDVKQVLYEDSDTDTRTFDVAAGESWPTAKEARSRKNLAAADIVGENLRLLYVALTRARHHTAVWWSSTPKSNTTGLARVLFARDSTVIDPDLFTAKTVPLPADGDIVPTLAAAFGAGDGIVDVVLSPPAGRRGAAWADASSATATGPLQLATLDVPPPRLARRWSFTAIADHDTRTEPTSTFDADDDSLGDAGAADERSRYDTTSDADDDDSLGDDRDADERPRYDTAPGSDDDSLGDARAADERPRYDTTSDDAPSGLGTQGGASPTTPDTSTPDTSATDTGSGAITPELPLGAIAGSARFGELVHGVLERVDFTTADLDGELLATVSDRLRWSPWPVDPASLAAGLRATIDTPLGPLVGSRRLRDMAPGDCLRELRFELLLGSGSRQATDRDLGAMVAAHLPDDHPLRPWAERLATGPFGVDLAGHLTGSIDVVFRVRDPEDPDAEPRFVVADYKTNTLGEPGRAPRSDDYRSDRLATAMADHHYPLQALLYAVALHRYLRWRLPGYDPAVHLGGAAYLFVRGMAGPATPLDEGHPRGVFSWDIGAALVTDTSDLLAGRLAAR